MIIERFVTSELAQVAYAVGDGDVGEVALIDPRRDVEEYVGWAENEGLRIVAILETHVHADFVSGAPALAEVTGAPVYASRLGEQGFDHVPVDDGMTLDIGAVRLTAIHTPGHTPEHMSWRAGDTRVPDNAPVLFSGDALFVGEVGRPDLLGEGRAQELVDDLYDTVTKVLKRLPDEMVVCPGHTAGSSCGRNIGSAPHTTIAHEKAMNYAFKPASRESFARAVMGGMPAPPAYYPVLKKVNTVGATPLHELSELHPLTVEQLEERLAAGAMVIDVRSQQEFAAGHIRGSIFVGAGPNFTTWMGWLAPYDRDLALVAGDAGQARDALTMLRRIGLDRVAGYLVGVDRWRESGRALETLEVVSGGDVIRERQRGERPTVLDVRSDDEYEAGHIDGAEHHFLARMTRGEMPDLDRHEEITVVCGSAYRSTVAVSLMRAHGFERVRNLADGMNAWNERTDQVGDIRSGQ